MAGVVIPLSEIAKAPMLHVEAIEGPDLNALAKKEFDMNACGMIGSKRNKNDGCVILGTSGTSKQLGNYSGLDLPNNDENDAQNDFVIGFNTDEDDPSSKKHMIIKYSLNDRRYYMRDLGDGSGTFVKISNFLCLKNGYIISFGDSHMTVNFVTEGPGANGMGGNNMRSGTTGGSAYGVGS